jgi:4-amino-4-deoxy-L-arabinose transferase-like glycosyltransferase
MAVLRPDPPVNRPKTASLPNPALVSRQAAQRLPRWVLLLFCAAYVLPGVFGREPWKNADLTAMGYMLALARGESSWLAPTLVGLPAEGGLLPYWIGSVSIQLLGGWLGPALAARLPFALLLTAALALLWYATYHLARHESAQPLAFAFGGEASPIDYARALADAALLALIASLGLLQLGHETTPELVQLTATALFLYGLAAAPYRPWTAPLAVVAGLAALAVSGAAAMGGWFGVVAVVLCLRSRDERLRRFSIWVGLATLGAAALAAGVQAWAWRLAPSSPDLGLLRLLAWFTWPVWPLAAWTLWQWRRQLGQPHIALPLGIAATGLLSCVAMGGNDRALMLALPGLAVLAAFALPTLKRSVSAAIDWFSVFFFSAAGLIVWVMYLSVHAGVPAQPAINVARLLPGFRAQFNGWELAIALAGTLAWAWLVRWRTGHHRRALWKSLILPAGGVAWGWLLTMTLWLPILDYARSARPMVRQLARALPEGQCLIAPNAGRPQLAALYVHGNWRLTTDMDAAGCRWMVVHHSRRLPPLTEVNGRPLSKGWTFVREVERKGERNEMLLIYRRT